MVLSQQWDTWGQAEGPGIVVSSWVDHQLLLVFGAEKNMHSQSKSNP